MPDVAPQNKLVAAWLRLPGNLRGVVWITTGSLAFALNDTVIKLLGTKYDPFQLAFARYIVGLVVLAPLFISMGVAGLKTERLGVHMTRLVIASIAQVGVVYSVIHLYLADATAIAFSRPLFTTVAAVFLLSEAVSRKRWTATAIGFLGVLIMVRPGHDGFDPVAVIAVFSALTFAVANVLIRVMSSTEPPNRILFYYHAGGAVVFLVPAILVWQTPVGIEWLLLTLIGVLTTLGMIGFVRGFAAGEANAVGPMEYIRLIYAVILGYLIFAEVPSLWTWAGAIIIIACTFYIARDEARARNSARTPPLP
jgi:drug/metabolite transporter (DMT)-like permease